MKYKTKRELLNYLIALFLGMGICYLYYNRYSLISKVSLRSTPIPTTNVDLHADEPHLNSIQNSVHQFESTIRNCLGPSCFDEPVVVESKKIFRVGILSPKAGCTTTINNYLIKFSEDIPHQFDIQSQTHVPAYGYGKNHGWSRIIRIIRKIPSHTIQLIRENPYFGDEMIKYQARQLIRWHCRLSHVAAHTKMLTIFLEDLVQRPSVEMEKMLTFVGVKYNRERLMEMSGEMREVLLREMSFPPPTPLIPPPPRSTPTSSSSSILIQTQQPSSPPPSPPLSLGDEYWYQNISHHELEILSSALSQELSSTRELTQWPCPSFREIESDFIQHLLQQQQHTSSSSSSSSSLPLISSPQDALSLLPMKASDLAADCSAPHVTCSVPFDQKGG